jgi:hypothetical protein
MQSYIDSGTGFRVIKWADGRCEVQGTIPSTPIAASSGATVAQSITVTLPAVFSSVSINMNANVNPSASNDYYGVIYYLINTVTNVSVVVKNGATAQNASGNFIAVGRWY